MERELVNFIAHFHTMQKHKQKQTAPQSERFCVGQNKALENGKIEMRECDLKIGQTKWVKAIQLRCRLGIHFPTSLLLLLSFFASPVFFLGLISISFMVLQFTLGMEQGTHSFRFHHALFYSTQSEQKLNGAYIVIAFVIGIFFFLKKICILSMIN